jgi:monovalent cation:H+ antiporter-2, CPA2 family
VRKIAIPGAIFQIAIVSALGAIVTRMFGWSWTAGMVYGMAISVASTVVLTRVLADNRDLQTPSGHIAIGWLIVEDLFTILLLVLLPALFGATGDSGGGVWMTLCWALLKLTVLIAFAHRRAEDHPVVSWLCGAHRRAGSFHARGACARARNRRRLGAVFGRLNGVGCVSSRHGRRSVGIQR